MAGIFGGSAGPVGSNISDYTSLPFSPNASTTMGPVANPQAYTEALGYSGMGPVASGQQYGQFLQSQQPSVLEKANTFLGDLGKNLKTQNQQQVEPMQWLPMQSQQQVQLPQVNLMDFLNMMGGK